MRTKAVVSMRQTFTAVATLAAVLLVAGVAAAQQRPNIVVIMGDDIPQFAPERRFGLFALFEKAARNAPAAPAAKGVL